MIRIYHARWTRSIRPIWLCHELGLPVEIETIDFSERFRSTPGWRAISPAGKIPVLVDGDQTMFESGAMVDCILERYGDGRLVPQAGTADSALYRQWCWFSEATLIRPLGVSRMIRPGASDEALASEGLSKILECLAVVDRAVAERRYLVGHQFSAADIMMGYSLYLLANFEVLDGGHPGALAYLNRLREREAFQRAVAV
jgi:glutathione S-transferase